MHYAKRYIVYNNPVSSPDDYYHVETNTIDDIIGIFKTKEDAQDYCDKENLYCIKIKEIITQE